jgi:putative transposase
MANAPPLSRHTAWAHLRFAVVGPLLSAPPKSGALKTELEALSRKCWLHPVTGLEVSFAPSTIERWFYQARRAAADPVGALRRKVRKDAGCSSALSDRLISELLAQYKRSSDWSVQLHADNLRARVEGDSTLGPMPSYASVRRFMRSRGMERRRPVDPQRPGMARAEARRDSHEVRSYEAEYVNGLWHLDFHVSSLKVLTAAGQWVYPRLLGVLDDHSRLCCHAQWYFSETTEDLVHGLTQAFCKRGLPRAVMNDNGSAMKALEYRSGLGRLSIEYCPTLDYSPHQNGKKERFWDTVEGRLMAMLRRVRRLTIEQLNECTCAWVEMEYNREKHSETDQTPLNRFLDGASVSRPCPSIEDLRLGFRMDQRRTQRRGDGTVSIAGVRFEVPNRFRHLRHVTVRYARWNLHSVHLVDDRTDTLLAPIYPLDKTRNADGRRRRLPSSAEPPVIALADGSESEEELPPLMRKHVAEYAATGIPPAYIMQPDTSDTTTTPKAFTNEQGEPT